MAYPDFHPSLIYSLLIPPECKNGNEKNFTTKGDVYFYGWILIELFVGAEIKSYDINEAKQIIESTLNSEQRDLEILSLIYRTLSQVSKHFSLNAF